MKQKCFEVTYEKDGYTVSGVVYSRTKFGLKLFLLRHHAKHIQIKRERWLSNGKTRLDKIKSKGE